jgi:hypothetical protein
MTENTKMDTLSERMNDLKTKGYREEFKISGNSLQTNDGSHSFSPNQIKINEHFRFEGESDPADMTVLYAVETNSGIKGLLIDAFGVYSNPEDAAFMQKIRELHKGNIY